MACPIPFGEANLVLGIGENDPDVVRSIEVFRSESEYISRWQLTEEELKELVRNGGKVYLRVLCSKSPPPVAVQVISPFSKR